MRKSLLMSAAALGLLALPAMAQDTSSTKSPPAPNSGASAPQPANSVPVGGATANSTQSGDVTTGTGAAQPSVAGQTGDQGAMTGMQPMRKPHHRMSMAHHKPMNRNAGEVGAETGGGKGEPASSTASNIDRGDTHREVAPALPMPAVRGNGPEAYLAAADHAIAHHQSGEAQEALERAETRMLDRSVPAGQGNMPESDPRLTQIHDARMALANHDYSAAQHSIQQAMNMPGSMGQGNMGQGNMGMNHGAMGQGQMMGQPAMQPGMAQPNMAPPASGVAQ